MAEREATVRYQREWRVYGDSGASRQRDTLSYIRADTVSLHDVDGVFSPFSSDDYPNYWPGT